MATYKTKLPDGRLLQIQDTELFRFASELGLDKIAPGRYSTLFVFKMFLYTELEGVESHYILEELKALEGQANAAPTTKPATQFTQEPLKGMWHQHFFSARFVPQNIAAHMNKKKISETVNRIMDPARSPVVTLDMVNELAKAFSSGAFEERENQGKLTGEWIVFAKHNGGNYYLTLTTHPADRSTGDQRIFDEIKTMTYAQFPFLAGL